MGHHLDTMDATALLAAVADGSLARVAIADHFLTRIARDEPAIQAFVAFDAPRARFELLNAQGPLAGLYIGVKDNFDTVQYPTCYHSALYQHHQPARDAQVVARLRQAGAVVLGKTHTTEFAYMHTGPTCNPHDVRRTPGSSSAGSAAGMAAGFFPLALGTQTAGSLIKPAAYCGTYAFKPSYGLASLEGIKPLAPSFDTPGWFGRSARDLALLAKVLIPGLPAPAALTGAYVFCRTARDEHVEPSVVEAVQLALERLRSAGFTVIEKRLPAAFDTVFDDHQLINDCEGARSFAYEAQHAPTLLSESFTAMLERAGRTTWQQESAAKSRIAALAPVLAELMKPFDAWLSYSCGIVAPLGLGSTGPSDFIKCWMAFGLPQVNIPLPPGPGGLPIGLQMIGQFRDDSRLLAAAIRVAGELAGQRSVP